MAATAGSAGVTTFVDPGVYHKSNVDSGYVQFVGHGFKQDGGTRPPPAPQPPNPGFHNPFRTSKTRPKGIRQRRHPIRR
jgi:hypothetical protein